MLFLDEVDSINDDIRFGKITGRYQAQLIALPALPLRRVKG